MRSGPRRSVAHFMSVRRCAGLHGGDDAYFFEAVEIAGKQDLGVFDAEAVGRRGVGCFRSGLVTMLGVGAVFGWRWREVGDLIGYCRRR